LQFHTTSVFFSLYIFWSKIEFQTLEMYSQSNIEALFTLIGKIPNQECKSTEHFDYIKTQNSLWPNKLYNLKATSNNIDDVLNEIEKKVKLGILPKQLLVEPSNENLEIIGKLKARNYKQGSWATMWHNMLSVKENHPIENFEIKEVSDEKMLLVWQNIVETGLMGGEPLNPEIFKWLLKDKNCFFFLGLANNKPVASSMLFNHNKIGGIYLVATLSSHRKKGYGSQITNCCVLKAKETNCIETHLQATDLGKSVYLNLGFKESGKVNIFMIDRV
jgi:hypothetical protein